MKLIRKFLITTCIICLSFTNLCGVGNIFASEEELYTLKDYLDDEASQDTTSLDSELEASLNEQGIFDDEIEAMSEDTLALIESGMAYTVECKYYVLTETDEEDYEEAESTYSISDEEENVYEIKDSELDNVINSVYGNGESDDNSTLSSLLDLNTITVNAATTTETDSTKSASGIFKQTLVVSQTNKQKKVSISYTCKWISSPKNRKTDVYGIHLKNGSFDKDTVEATYKYTKFYGTITDSRNKTTTTDVSGTIKSTDSGVAAKANLKNDALSGSYTYINQVLSISGTATIDDYTNWSYIVAYGEYYHQQTTINHDVTFSLGSSGGITFNASTSDIMNDMTPNVYIKFYFNK